MKDTLMWDLNLFTDGDDETLALWTNTLSKLKGTILFIVGVGVDPRMYTGIEKLFNSHKLPKEKIFCIGLSGAAPVEGIKFKDKEKENVGKINELFNNNYEELRYRQDESNLSMAVCLCITKNVNKIVKYDNVIVDISAMPSITFLTLVPQLLNLFQDKKSVLPSNKKNLLVMASESFEQDSSIEKSVLNHEAIFLHQFKGGSGLTQTSNLPAIWIPVLSMVRETEIKAIYVKVEKEINAELDVVPLLPFPSKNPRRSDDILGKNANLFFQSFDINHNNILYAAENRPFELYRRLMKAFIRYGKSLELLGGCRFFVSPLSGKLMAIGAILSCYEAERRMNDFVEGKFQIGVPLVEPKKYRFEDNFKVADSSLSMLWLLGCAYNVE